MKKTALTIIIALLLFISSNVYPQGIPQTINYQGVLKDGSGNLVPNEDYQITFRLYNAVSGGTALWTETQIVPVVDGVLSTRLGDAIPLNLPFDIPYYLGISIGSNSELIPRAPLTSVPYSINSINSMISQTVPDSSLTSEKISSGQVVKSFNSLTDNVNLVAGSNVTITPSGNNITISATGGGGGGGTVTEVQTGAGLTGGPITTTGTISIPDNGITSAMLQNNSVTSAKIVDGTISGTDIANNTIGAEKLSFTPGTGTVTSVATGSGLTGGPITTTGTISIPNNGITSAMLQNNSVTSAKIVDGTITAADIANTQVVKSINTLKDDVSFVAGSNITITPSGNNLTISSTAGGIGGTGTTNYIPRFTGNTTLGNSIIYESSSNIGIGRTNPTRRLDVLGASGTQEVARFEGSSNQMYVSIYENGTYRGYIGSYSGNAEDVDFGTGGGSSGSTHLVTSAVPRLTINSSGNVGIGTQTPSGDSRLNVTTNAGGTVLNAINSTITGTNTSIDYVAVRGLSNHSPGYGIGGVFTGGYRGVQGVANGLSYSVGSVFGVDGYADGTGTAAKIGVQGWADGSGTKYGVYGLATGTGTNWAGYFLGNVTITGTLSKGGGSFKIDHPLDPTNKYLYHSFVESPDMMNIYNGNVTTDGSGYAAITLPEWFEALNKDFRYQLTVIGDFAQAIIAQEVQGNQFAIRTDKPNIKVSWQVTGIRKDAFAEKHRIPVEEMKNAEDRGKYLHPEAFGLPESTGTDYSKTANDRRVTVE